MSERVLVFGGAGFLGSHLVHRFVQTGWKVSVIDGLMPQTGGNAGHLAGIPGVELIARPIEDIPDLSARTAQADLIIDAMGWTAHLLALENPRYDLQLNADAHLRLLQALRGGPRRRVIYLGSRGQYGNTLANPLQETSPMEPNDIQGIHKVAAESYFRVAAARGALDVVSLRLPNCFGERQPTSGPDLGLVGGFIRDALQDRQIEVFGNQRSRSVIYAGDVADISLGLAKSRAWSGFSPFNVGGHYLTIAELAALIVRLAGRGQIVAKEIPPEIKAIDAGSSRLDATKLDELLGKVSYSPLEPTLARTIRWIQAHFP